MINSPQIYLEGGGDGRGPIQRAFARGVRSAGATKAVLFLPFAMAPERWMDCRAWFTSVHEGLFEDVVMPHDPARIAAENTRFDAIYLGGGDTGRLLDTLRGSGLDRFVARHASRGGPLFGVSAGAIVCGRSILTAPPEEHSSAGNDGLDLLGGASVVPHFDGTTEARARARRAAAELGGPVWAIPEDCGVRLLNNDASNNGDVSTLREVALGADPCLCFTADGGVAAIAGDGRRKPTTDARPRA